MRPIRVALAGNPNTGKSSIFNRLTGSSVHTGNYSGVTVEVSVCERSCAGTDFEFTDLPGMYSLSGRSGDEAAAASALLASPPDVILDVVDATNLERNLQLAVQLAQTGIPLVIALNMSDSARRDGRMPDTAVLGRLLGASVVPTAARTGEGIEKLVLAVARAFESGIAPAFPAYGGEVGAAVSSLAKRIPAARFRGDFIAGLLLEGGEAASAWLDRSCPDRAGDLRTASAAEADRLERRAGDRIEVLLASARMGIASGIARESLPPPVSRTTGPALTRRIDDVLLGRLWGLPAFAIVMYTVFWLTFRASAPGERLLHGLLHLLISTLSSRLPEGPLPSLLLEGILPGVGGVLLFVPAMAVMFLAIAVMEDTGYMARAAFLTDGFMHRIGLHGRSFIPMLLGFGCTVPAVLATRPLEGRRDRLATILVLPLMSCGARLPVYLLVIGAFFPGTRALALAAIYLTGVLLALPAARLLRRTVLRGEESPFVMELPPYRLPTLAGVARHTWERVKHYLVKAGTVILAFSVLLWFACYYPRPPAGHEDPAAAVEHSFAGRAGHFLEPAFRPMGFDWRVVTAMIGAMGSRELFISQMGILQSLEEGPGQETSLEVTMRERYSPASGIAMMLFVLIGAPCVATVAVVRREAGGWRWAVAQYAGLTVMAWIFSALAAQAWRLFA